MYNRNIVTILVAQPLVLVIAPMLVLIGGLMGLYYAPSPSWATLPVACMVIGTALAASPAAFVYNKLGRKLGALIGAAIALSGALLGALATIIESFALLCLATGISGAAIAFGQQLRFAAVEALDDKNNAPKVLSALLLASLVSAFVGPEIGARGEMLFDTRYLGSFLLLAIIIILAGSLLLGLNIPKQSAQSTTQARVKRSTLLKNPDIILAIASSAIGFAVMTFLMTATPLSMQYGCNHSGTDTKWVIQSHIVAMFLPSLITPKLIARFGIHKVMMAGVLAYILVLVVALSGQEVIHFWWALVLLGLGWNFLFLAGNSLLAQSYTPEQANTAQGLNDTIVFGVQAIASLSAGVIYGGLGWQAVIWLSLPATLTLLVVLVWRQRTTYLSH
ncbi:MFS transporter [Salinibius halmophilus]|uniref:MFS transporter n=1 Tax=Salinibius halmophilus TaxID=1853216 RepID=UPI002D799F31|nr:MFS transporter [Salinibius halmophilus]